MRKKRTVWNDADLDTIAYNFITLRLTMPEASVTQLLVKAQEGLAHQRKLTGLSQCKRLALKVQEIGIRLLSDSAYKERYSALEKDLAASQSRIEELESKSPQRATTEELIAIVCKRFADSILTELLKASQSKTTINESSFPELKLSPKVTRPLLTVALVGGSTVRDFPLVREALPEDKVDLRHFPAEGNGKPKLSALNGLRNRDFVIVQTAYTTHSAQAKAFAQLERKKVIRWNGDRPGLEKALQPILERLS